MPLEGVKLWLQRSTVCSRGEIERLALTRVGSDNSRAFRIALSYAADAGSSLPRKLFLKICGDESSGQFGPSEVRYYTHDYADAPDAPLPQCFGAAFEPETQRYHVLLEDLSDTHRPCMERGWGGELRGLAGEGHARALATSLAKLRGALGASRLGPRRHPLPFGGRIRHLSGPSSSGSS
jgi:hypothetical protein